MSHHILRWCMLARQHQGAELIEFLQNLIVAGPLEFYTAIVATAGIVFWFLDRKSMKAALVSAEGAQAISLRLERLNAEARVEQSLLELQMRCQMSRDAWLEHNRRCGPRLGPPSVVSQEQKDIQRLEQTGRALLDRLVASAPVQECSNYDELQGYLVVASRTSQEITRLGSHVPMPSSSFT